MGRTLLKALIRRKSDEFLVNASQKAESKDPIRHFEDHTRKKGCDAMHLTERNSITPNAYLPENDVVFPTKEFLTEIVKDIKTAKQRGPHGGKFRTYGLKRLRAKSILANLKSDILKQIIKFKHCLNIIDRLKFIDGTILASNNQIFFILNFEAQTMYSIVLDRRGNTVSFCTRPKRRVNYQEREMPSRKLLDPQKIRTLENDFFSNLINSFDENAEEDMLKEIFGIQPRGKATFIEGQMIRKKDEVFFEVVVVTKFDFSLIVDLYGNYLDITAVDSSSDWVSLIEKSSHRGGSFPTVNVFHSNIDRL